MKTGMKKIFAVLLVVMLAAGFVACGGNGGGNGSGESTDPATMDKIQGGIHTVLKDYLMASSDTFTEDSFENGQLPMYDVTRLKKGDGEFESYLQGLEIDPSAVEDFLRIQSMVIVKSDSIIVMRVNDMEKAKEGLAKFHEGQLKIWESYLPDQYEKAKNNVTGSEGDYLYYVTSDAQEEVLAVIREQLK